MTTMRRRRVLLCALIGAIASGASVAGEKRPARIFWHGDSGNVGSAQAQQRIRAGFASRGLVEGRDIAIVFLVDDEAPPEKIVAGRPDVIVMLGDIRLGDLRRLTRDIPVVFYNFSADPVRVGLVETLRRPGGNFTGTVVEWDEIVSKYWQLLKELRPAMRRGANLREEGDDHAMRSGRYEAERRAAERLGIEIRDVFVPRDASATAIAAAVRAAGADGIVVDEFSGPGLGAFVGSTAIPTIGYSFGGVRGGRQLMGISFDWTEGESQAIATVTRILRGERPGTIPVYQARSYGLAVNLRLARAAGIAIPDSVLIQAKEVVR